MYLDVHYADGSKDWGKTASWTQGTHDWEKTVSVLIPKQPIEKIEAFVFVRVGEGKAEFRDIFLERREGKGDRFGESRMSLKPFEDVDIVSYSIFTGNKIFQCFIPVRMKKSVDTLCSLYIHLWQTSQLFQ